MPNGVSRRDSMLIAPIAVAGNLRGYESYRGSERRALAALEKQRPGFGHAVYEDALHRALAIVDEAQRVVDRYVTRAHHRVKDREPLVEACARRVEVRHPRFPARSYRDLVSWVYLFFHEM